MASPEILDFSTLLKPISDTQPTGENLKSHPVRHAVHTGIREARDAARSAEFACQQFGLLEGPPPCPPDWRNVMDLAVEALSRESKDLWIAAWLIEALTREYGFAGLRDGLRLVTELIARYWETLHPRLPDEDDDYVLAMLQGLAEEEAEGTLFAPLLALPITAGTAQRPLATADYDNSRRLQYHYVVSEHYASEPQRLANRLARGDVPLDVFRQEAAATPRNHLASLLEDIEQADKNLGQLHDVLVQKQAGSSDPSATLSVTGVRGALTECRECVQFCLGAHPSSVE